MNMLAHNAMTDNSFQLVYRIAQLETELRFTQEKLGQAEGANAYLLQQLASLASSPGLAQQSQPISRGNLLECSDDIVTKPLANEPRDDRERRTQLSGSLPVTLNAATLGDADPHASRSGQSLSSKLQRADDSTVTQQGKSAIEDKTRKLVEPRSLPQDRKDSTGVVSHVTSIPGPHTRTREVFRQSMPGSRVHLQYNHLLGAACFIEDMDAHGKSEHWQKFARDFPYASAAQWESYYESDIRPGYLAKQRAREPAASSPIRPALDNHGHVLSVDAERVPGNKGELPISQQQQEGRGAGENPPTLKRVDSLTHLDELLITFDKVDDKVGAELPPAVEVEMALPPPPAVMPTPLLRDRPRVAPPLEVNQLFYNAPAADVFPFRTALVTDVPPGTGLDSALNSIKLSDIVSAKYIRTSGMKLKIGMVNTDTIMIVFRCGERLKNVVDESEGKLPISSQGPDQMTASISIIRVATHPVRLNMVGSTELAFR
jgi:hypothetical protein